MVFISERIRNISDLEEMIQGAKFNFEVLSKELDKEAPSKTIIDGASYQVKKNLESAVNFEFVMEKRMCDIKDSCENHKWMESLSEAYS